MLRTKTPVLFLLMFMTGPSLMAQPSVEQKVTRLEKDVKDQSNQIGEHTRRLDGVDQKIGSVEGKTATVQTELSRVLEVRGHRRTDPAGGRSENTAHH